MTRLIASTVRSMSESADPSAAEPGGANSAAEAPDEEHARLQGRYDSRVALFKEDSGLSDEQFIPSAWAIPFVPVQYPSHGPDPSIVVRAPANVRPEFSLHPVYFCDPMLMGVFPTDGRDARRYTFRVFHLLKAWGLAGDFDSGRPGIRRVTEHLDLHPSADELAKHLRGERTVLSNLWFGRETLNPPLAQVLEEVWQELERLDPSGNERLREEREAQKAALASDDKINAYRAKCQEYQELSGLDWGEYADNDWGFPFVPFVKAWVGDAGEVLVQALANVKTSFLGHPVFWCDPSITAPMAIDGTNERYCLRMHYTFSAMGLVRPDRSLDDMLEHLGPQANDTARRNHLRGRQTPLDTVFLTWHRYGQVTRRHVLAVVWELLQERDPEGNARLADQWQEVLDLWEYEDYQAAKAEEERKVYEKARRKQARKQFVRGVVDTARDASDAIAERSEQKRAAFEQQQKAQARQIYIDNNRRR